MSKSPRPRACAKRAEGVRVRVQGEASTPYLATTPAAVKSRSLADLIAFNTAHAGRELGLFGQGAFVVAERLGGLDSPEYLALRAESLALAREAGLDVMLKANAVAVLVAPSFPPPPIIDPAFPFRLRRASERPSCRRLRAIRICRCRWGSCADCPLGLSFIGPAFSDGDLLRFGYAFEATGPLREPLDIDRVSTSAICSSLIPETTMSELADQFATDGAVVVRNVLTPSEVATLAAGIDANLAQPSPSAKIASRPDDPGRFVEDFCNWQRNAQYREVIFQSRLAAVAAELMGSRTVRLHHDHMLTKEAATRQRTPSAPGSALLQHRGPAERQFLDSR